ncbi:LysM peptidoglycan-binding domain-containing protein [Rhizobium halophytocola]|uniref:Nucleoid-associated protein YgaU n=2 Tax=Rhizobium halophytocola TaxID=735519 RepID=A0ABS4DYN5_9HYPH|nr:nucleoid-associated protein YgaU [Rhizobium halophytocola]
MNRAGWLALVVLAIATLVMVFGVMPLIKDQPADDTAKAPVSSQQSQPATASQSPVTDPSADAASTDEQKAAIEKVARLHKAAGEAIAGLATLFTNGNLPTAEAYAGARAVAQTAITALAAYMPEGLDDAAQAKVTALHERAQKALDVIRALPDDPKAAADKIAGLTDALSSDTPVADAQPATPGTANGTSPAMPAGQSAAANGENAASAPEPSFDVLRVEPDGSAVIAGSATPGAQVDILNGQDVIASTTAGPSGDFAAVLDDPLKPGDYALALRSTDKDGKATVSGEVASVSVPKDRNGELLAMISKPGAASEIITPPTSEQIASGKGGRVPGANAGSGQADTSAQQMAKQDAGPSTTTTTTPTTGNATGNTTTSATDPRVQVTAVEIEGDKIFIAGTSSTAGKAVAYADDDAVGSAMVATAGHFVIEGRQVLSVGQHTIRVDLTGAAGKVVVRTTVPFDRPAGTQVSAVAANGSQSSSEPTRPMVPLELGALEKQRDTLSKAFAILRSLFADGQMPAMEDLAAARSATEIALGALIDTRPGPETSPAVSSAVAKTAAAAEPALKTLHDLPATVEAVAAALPELSRLIDKVLNAVPEMAPPPQLSLASPSQADGPGDDEGTAPGSGPSTLEQAALQPSDNSVIIRKGDTLWQISRRVYGQGVRYTTIYLANEQQILNPDLIEPGQIFDVPATALPNAAELHRRRMEHLPIR